MSNVDSVLTQLEFGFEDAIARLCELLRIPSISTDPNYVRDCAQAAKWLVDDLRSIGFDADAFPTDGHPMVMGHLKSNEPTDLHVIFYGHYDVQPPDPLDLWVTPPFEPRVAEGDEGSEGCIVARGAMDDKGQLMTFIEACRATMAVHGKLPISVTVLIEGEEESGSASLRPFLEAHKGLLEADYVLVCDTLMWDRETPAVTSMLRGMMAAEITVAAANRDLHSGLYGNAAQNPINLMAQVLSALKGRDGLINVPGFYDGVGELSPKIIDQWKSIGFDQEKFLGDIGLSEPAGEKDRHILEQIWSRPSCDVNGIWGGYTGEGYKTVIPSSATAKVSFRLVAGQDPAAIQEQFEKFLASLMPKDCSVSVRWYCANPAVTCDVTSDVMSSVVFELTTEYEKDAVFIGCGGSIPIVEIFADVLGIESILVGFGLEDDRAHSPNEKYEISSFRHGARFWARLMNSMGMAAHS